MINEIQGFNLEYKKIICKNIKKFRKEKKIKLMLLAELLEVTPDYLKRLESPSDERKTCWSLAKRRLFESNRKVFIINKFPKFLIKNSQKLGFFCNKELKTGKELKTDIDNGRN